MNLQVGDTGENPKPTPWHTRLPKRLEVEVSTDAWLRQESLGIPESTFSAQQVRVELAVPSPNRNIVIFGPVSFKHLRCRAPQSLSRFRLSDPLSAQGSAS